MDLGMIELQARARQEALLLEAEADRRTRGLGTERPDVLTGRTVVGVVGIVLLALALLFGGGLAEASPGAGAAGGGGAAVVHEP